MQYTIHADFETRSTLDLKRVGADVYAKHSTTDALCMAFAFTRSGESSAPISLWKMGEAPSPELKRLFTFLNDGMKLKAHNVAFELAIWNHVMAKRYGWPRLLPEQTGCTMAQAYAMGLPGSLEKAAAAVGIAAQKDMAGSRVMMQLCRPRELRDGGVPVWWTPEENPEKYERLYAYCIQDLVVEMELDTRLIRLPDSERAVWLLDQKINNRGILIDRAAVEKALAMVEFEKERLNLEMQRVTGGAVSTVSATGQLTDWIGWQLGEAIDGVAKADVLALLDRENLPDQVRRALEIRREGNKSSTAKLSAMLEAAGEDGRVRGAFQYHGAGTGRWAGRRIQVQNYPRGSLSAEEVGAVFDVLGGCCD